MVQTGSRKYLPGPTPVNQRRRHGDGKKKHTTACSVYSTSSAVFPFCLPPLPLLPPFCFGAIFPVPFPRPGSCVGRDTPAWFGLWMFCCWVEYFDAGQSSRTVDQGRGDNPTINLYSHQSALNFHPRHIESPTSIKAQHNPKSCQLCE
jgi:hypothetical protein